MRNSTKFLFVLLFSPLLCEAQFNFEYDDSIGVRIGVDTLEHAWVGGLNYAQFSDIDIDFDGDLDLFVFDRSSDNIRIFTQENEGNGPYYKYLYRGKTELPSDIRYRATAIDYNADGAKDLFVYGIGGIKVYRNVGNVTSGNQWEVAKNLLYSDYAGANLNLYVSSADIPAIVDVDNDGDIDVLTFHIGGQHMQYHKNISMETYGVPDSLEFILKNECWGKFREDITTSVLYLNDNTGPCSNNVPNPEYPLHPEHLKTKPSESYPKHAGSTILAIDMDNSGVKDIILGDVAFPSMSLLINGGTDVNTNSAMISQDNTFPSNSLPVNLQLFPAAFWVDVDFDQKKDLIAAPNAKNVSQNEKSVLRYKNLGTNALPTFVYQENDFLQGEMIDQGTGSIPVFMDFNNDGLEDMFVTSFYRYKPVLDKECGISFYKNTGTATQPFFTFIDNDLLNLSTIQIGLRKVPTFGDLDGDGDKDMILSLENGSLSYYTNTSVAPGISFANPIINMTDNSGAAINTGQYATPQLFDIDKDGLLDLIIGKKTGELMFYRNTGSSTAPSFTLENDTLGSIDIATTSPDGYAAPHFFRHNDTTYLFLGGIDGHLRYYTDIDGHLTSGDTFSLYSDNFLDIDAGAYSSFWVNDIDNDGFLDLFIGQDLGGITHLEVKPGSTAGIDETNKMMELNVFPNPTNGFIHAESSLTPFRFVITDLFGKTLLKDEHFTFEKEIDLSSQSSGLYLLIAEDEQGNRRVNRIVRR
jgi:hypothetical protein